MADEPEHHQPPPPAPTDSIQSRVVGYLAYWFRDTHPLHKFLDVLVLALAGVFGLTLWGVYTQQETIVNMVGDALRSRAVIDIVAAEKGWAGAWDDAQSEGAVAIELWEVDLQSNTRRLLKMSCVDPAHEQKIRQHIKRPFVSMTDNPEINHIIGDLLSGDPAVGPRSRGLGDLMALWIPLPDEPAEMLVGVLIVSFPLDIDRDSIRVVRGNLLQFTKGLTGG